MIDDNSEIVQELCLVIGEHVSINESGPITSVPIQNWMHKRSARSAYRTLETDGRREHGTDLEHFNPEVRPDECEEVYDRVFRIAYEYPAWELWMDDSFEWKLRGEHEESK